MDITQPQIILIHAGSKHSLSNKLRSLVMKAGLSNCRCVPVNDLRIKQWLQCNTRKIHISELPCFLVYHPNEKTRVLDYTYCDELLIMAKHWIT